MHYLRKAPDSRVVAEGWQYPRDAKAIREALLAEQHGFCAYSERFVRPTDSCDVEHFDPRLKGTVDDGYWNWYTVLHWMNSHKSRKIDEFQPILTPHDPTLPTRIAYADGEFVATNDNDQEAKNLIDYLGWNRFELFDERRNHIGRIRSIRDGFSDDVVFFNYLSENREEISFITALCVEFGLDASRLR